MLAASDTKNGQQVVVVKGWSLSLACTPCWKWVLHALPSTWASTRWAWSLSLWSHIFPLSSSSTLPWWVDARWNFYLTHSLSSECL